MSEIITKTQYGLKTFSEPTILFDIKPREYAWWEKILIGIVYALMLAFVLFAIFFYINFPAQLATLAPMLLFVMILSRR